MPILAPSLAPGVLQPQQVATLTQAIPAFLPGLSPPTSMAQPPPSPQSVINQSGIKSAQEFENAAIGRQNHFIRLTKIGNDQQVIPVVWTNPPQGKSSGDPISNPELMSLTKEARSTNTDLNDAVFAWVANYAVPAVPTAEAAALPAPDTAAAAAMLGAVPLAASPAAATTVPQTGKTPTKQAGGTSAQSPNPGTVVLVTNIKNGQDFEHASHTDQNYFLRIGKIGLSPYIVNDSAGRSLSTADLISMTKADREQNTDLQAIVNLWFQSNDAAIQSHKSPVKQAGGNPSASPKSLNADLMAAIHNSPKKGSQSATGSPQGSVASGQSAPVSTRYARPEVDPNTITTYQEFQALTLRQQRHVMRSKGLENVEVVSNGKDKGKQVPVYKLVDKSVTMGPVPEINPKTGSIPARYTNFEAKAKEYFDSNPPAPSGKGLKRRNIVMRGYGFSNSVESAAGIPKLKPYVSFGRHFLNRIKLGQGMLIIRRSGGNTIPELPTQRISDNLKKVLEQLIDGLQPSFGSVYGLSNQEKDLYNRIIKHTSIDQRLQIPAPELNQDQKDWHRFQVLIGEVAAGNDNTQMIKELKGLLIKLSSKKILPKAQVHEILCDLVALGY
jgi:hypothetical protein